MGIAGNTETFKRTISVERYPISVSWRIPDKEKYGEILTCWAHLYGHEISTNFAEIELINNGSDDIDLTINVDVDEYTSTCSKTITIGPGEKEVFMNPSFNENLADITTTIPVETELTVYACDTSTELFRDTKRVELLPLNYYRWSNRIEGVLVLATPHAEVITDILNEAAEKTPWGAIVGYQNVPGYEKRSVVSLQMKAIYDTIDSYGYKYVSTPTTFSGTEAQRIKTPTQAMNDDCGNCIETSLLFDSCFEAIGFKSNLIFMTGHVFVSCDRWIDDPTHIAMETTTVGYDDFYAAQLQAYETWDDLKYDLMAKQVSVKEIRDIGVLPVPWLDVGGAPSQKKFLIYPNEDSYVVSWKPNDNSGGNNVMLLTYLNLNGESYRMNDYLKFTLSEIPEGSTIKKATLTLYAASNASRTVNVGIYGCLDNSWNEMTITWNNAPISSNELISSQNIVLQETQKYSWDITDYIRNSFSIGKSSVSLVLKQTTEVNSFYEAIGFCAKEKDTTYYYFPTELEVEIH